MVAAPRFIRRGRGTEVMSARHGQSGYVKSGPVDISYDVEGPGPPLLLLDGGMGTIGEEQRYV
jgi:hypothetical protein